MKTKNQQILDLFQNRYTAKNYDKNKKVSNEDFMTIIEAARLSPSSFGYEPWKFIRLKDEKVLKEIAPYSWGAAAAFDGASHFVLVLARVGADMQPDSEYLEHIHFNVQNFDKNKLKGRKDRYRNFLDNDFKISESERTYFDWTSKQAYIPLTSMLLTAAALGVDSTPIEGFDRDKVHQVLVDNKVYDPKHFKLAVMVAFGHGDGEHRKKSRQSLAEIFEEF